MIETDSELLCAYHWFSISRSASIFQPERRQKSSRESNERGVEKIFTVPGMGVHIVESVSNRDQTVILATVLTYSAFLVVFNLLVDLAYGLVDPRIRLGDES